MARARGEIEQVLSGLVVPTPQEAVAVGGSASSLRRLAGPLLDREALTRALQLLATDRATEVARRFALDRERVRLLPAGLLILQAASELFGTALQIGRGGVREGVLLEGER
jgi:exopolyphosphatase/guanosine-5'-triphosphate,3'-diphosphate pyrophosphatase